MPTDDHRSSPQGSHPVSATCRAVIITALPIERTAVLEHLRDLSEEPPLKGSIYRRGIFDERSDPWEVIVAEIGAGNEGAAAEAERVVAHYSPDVALFVGVAGAIKDLKHGDVVASTKVYGYESGKDDKGGFKTRPSVQLTAYALEQRARHEAGEPDWRQRIRRTGEAAHAIVPDARVAPIAAGEKVVASNRSRLYTFIRRHYGDAVAIEMEGHGFLLGVRMNHPTQGIVVRAISDRVGDKDEANDKIWQPIAARHAAAFAFQILAKYRGPGSRDEKIVVRLDPVWQEKHLQDARATAGPRYSAELRVGTPLHDMFEALGGTEEWLTSIRERGRKMSSLLKRFLGNVHNTEGGGWEAPFPEHLRAAGPALAGPVRSIEQAFDAIIAGSAGGTPAAVAARATAVLPQVRELHSALRSDLEKRYGKGTADSAHFRQFQAEYQLDFPAESLDRARDVVAALEELEVWGRSGPARASGSRGVLLLGGPGVGKTHGVCDIAHDRFRRGLYTVVLFGEQFASTDEPWERIRQIIGFGPTSRDGILEALDAAGVSSRRPLLLCIDGLNESRPRGYWRDWLAALATQVARYSNIRLCVSCRSTYELASVPESHSLERIEHVGFAGMEFTACRHFFAHYGLEPPVAPSFHPEFFNPLFLRLACETLQVAGVRRMPAGWHGLNTALTAFLREKNRAFAREYERDARERVPQRALHEFMAEVEQAHRVYLRWSDAAAVINRVHPPGLVGPTVLEWLIRAGLLITDVDPEDSNPDAEEVVRVAFERLGDHLFAARLLGGIKSGELLDAIASGSLSFAFADASAVLDNQGLVEALSTQVPEHTNFYTELIDVLPPGGPRDVRGAVLRATIAALPWRDPMYMTERTQRLVLEGLRTPGYGHEVFDAVLRVAAQVTAPDALWLHGLLTRQSMRFRDGFLCGYLHMGVDKPSAVERLLRAPFEVEPQDIPEAVCYRWAILLLWFCLAADRRVRDRATKGLVAITQAHPKVWATLIEEFARVDDEYVVERCFCAAYGVLLRTRDRGAEREVAAAAYTAVFANPTILQNALIRDHARCIIELAQYDGVVPDDIDMSRVRPPYESDWPLTIPSEEAVKPYADADRDYPKLHISCLKDDFFTYTLSALESYEHAVRRKEMGRWILEHVVSVLGYGGEVLAAYDRHILYTHGGGRGRPRWAERIGKKYQLIALSRLAARLADHVKPKSKWDSEPKARGVQLVYAQGRDIDPSLLAHRLDRPEGAVWWLPVEYDFAGAAAETNTEWVASSSDVPSSESLLQPLRGIDGEEWQLLEGYPTWSARTSDDEEDDVSPRRQVWMQIRGYLVKRKSAERVFHWMAKQHFMGRWMPEGADFHEGYVGEYPWGVLFTMYSDRWHSSGVGGKRTPAGLMPVCNSILSSYEEDAHQNGGVTVHVPARVFFEEDGRLQWDGLGGYRSEQGRPRFLDPSAAEPGRPVLLVDRPYILDFLRRKDLAIVWSVLGEKIAVGGLAGASPRLEFSRAHILDQSGVLRSSSLLIPPGGSA